MKGIWPSERVNSQVDCLRADLSETSALTFIVKCFGQDQESKKTPDSDSLFQSVGSHPLEFLYLSLLPLSCTIRRPSALTLSRPAALFLFADLNFRSCFLSLCFCWALEDDNAPLTPHCPGEIEGRERIAQISKLNSYETMWNTHHAEERFWEWFMWNINTPGSNLRSPTQPGLSAAPQLRWVTCVHLSFS